MRKASELFSQVDIFQGLDQEIVGQLAAASQRRLFDAGETLVQEGDEGDSLFVIERGSVRVTKADPDQDGKSVDLAVLEEGAFFGEMSLLTGEPRSATVLAREHCGVLMLGKSGPGLDPGGRSPDRRGAQSCPGLPSPGHAVTPSKIAEARLPPKPDSTTSRPFFGVSGPSSL